MAQKKIGSHGGRDMLQCLNSGAALPNSEGGLAFTISLLRCCDHLAGLTSFPLDVYSGGGTG